MVQDWSRRDVIRAATAVGVGAATTPVLSGCSALGFGSTLDDVTSEGTIKVGIAGEVPYSFLDDDGNLTGAIGDLHKEVFRRMGDIGVEAVRVPFGQLLEGPDKGNFDAVAAGMFVLTDRCERAAFSEPVYTAPSALLVAKGNPEDLSDYASVADAGVDVAVLGAAVEVDYAKGAGVASGNVRSVSSQGAGLELVASGEVELLDSFAPVVDGEELLGCGAAAFRSNETDLRDAFNAELAALRDEGRLLEILEPWGFTEAEMPPEDLTTEQLCETGGLSGDVRAPVPR